MKKWLFLLFIPCLSFAADITDNINTYNYGLTVTLSNLVMNGDISGTFTETKEVSFIVTNVAGWTRVAFGPFPTNITLTRIDAICVSTATVYVGTFPDGLSITNDAPYTNVTLVAQYTNVYSTSFSYPLVTNGWRVKLWLGNTASDYLGGTNDTHVTLQYTKPKL